MTEPEQWQADLGHLRQCVAVDNFFVLEFLGLLGASYEDAIPIETRIKDNGADTGRAYPGLRLDDLRVYILNTREEGVVYTATGQKPAAEWIAERSNI